LVGDRAEFGCSQLQNSYTSVTVTI
jgi:hypothetical protein